MLFIYAGSGTDDDDDDDNDAEDTPKKKTKKKTIKDTSPPAHSAKDKKSKPKGMARRKITVLSLRPKH